MNIMIILAIQAKGAAILLIICLLLGAALIGYLTSWLFTKSIYVKKIEVIESEKEELNEQLRALRTEISDLNKSLGEKEEEIEKLKAKRK